MTFDVTENTGVGRTTIHRLHNGDHLRREEFERRYDATPEIKKAELIEGVVYVREPVRYVQHGGPLGLLIGWLMHYSARTPGTAFFTDATLRLDDENEPQPDAGLFIDAARGGQCRIDRDGILASAPELVVEVAASSVSYDLHSKLRSYRSAGVREYIVARSLDRAVDWFRFGAEESLNQGGRGEGVLDSVMFPGLRLDVGAYHAGDAAGMLAALDEGMSAPGHTDFVARLGG